MAKTAKPPPPKPEPKPKPPPRSKKPKPKPEAPPDLSRIDESIRSLAVPIASLVPDPKNARLHGDANTASVRDSLVERGQTLPITVRKSTRVVMTGNNTMAIAGELGWTHIAAIFLDYDEKQAAAWAIAHNQGASLASWDLPALSATMLEFPDLVTTLGFPEAQVQTWLAEGMEEAARAGRAFDAPPSPEQESPAPDEDDDEEIELPAEPITWLGEVVELGPHTLHCCDCMDLLRSLPDNSVDAIVTDPPYGLSPDGRARTWDDIEALRLEGKGGPTGGFMGNAWDAGVPGIEWARECLRVLKPGGHMIAHSATRTIHRLACAIEDAGFEIRDQLGWLHWQGFPKSHNIGLAMDTALGIDREVSGYTNACGVGGGRASGRIRVDPDRTERRDIPVSPDAVQWNGWGTSLKPACEPAVLARKPISEATVALNILRWGTGGLNIDGCRIPDGDKAWPGPDGALADLPYPKAGSNKIYGPLGYREGEINYAHPGGRFPANIYHCPKPGTGERNDGADDLPQESKLQLGNPNRAAPTEPGSVDDRFKSNPMGNTHPTVKPVKLYRWFLRLVTPPGGKVLEPFGGSGTTIVAATKEGFQVVAAERSPKYADIIRARVTHALARGEAF